MLLDFKKTDGTILQFKELVNPPVNFRKYYVIKQDDQIDPALYTRPGLNRPLVFRMETYRSIYMTRIIQDFLFDLNRTDDDSRDRDWFADDYDTWATNEGKIRDSANFITGERLNFPLPRWSTLVMGRNVLCGEKIISDGSFGIRNGTPCLKIETLDPDNMPAGLTYKTHPHLIHHCNIITDHKVNDLYQVNPFHSARTNSPNRPTFYGLMARGDVYIEMYKLIELPIGAALPNPYWPEWIF